jgi:DNA-binding FrmR family transcriptional regulator
MSERNNELDRISEQLSENILAVKGTLELVDTSVTEDELHQLLLKAIERMDNIQRQLSDMLVVLKNCLDKIDSIKK